MSRIGLAPAELGRLAVAFRVLVGGYLRQERGRSLLTLGGLALGVAVLVAIDLANQSAVGSFADTVREVGGRSTLTVRGNGGGLDPRLIGRLASAPGVTGVAPLIEGYATWAPPGEPPVQLTLLGVDFLQSEESDLAAVRDIRFTLAPGLPFGRLLADPGTVVLTRRLAERAGVALGGEVVLGIAGRPRPLRVGAWIDSGPLADALDGNLVVVDVGVADQLLGRGGQVDRFDLVTADGTDLEALAGRLQAALGPGVLVERPEARSRAVEQMVAAFRFNLDALGRIAIVVGAFLIYNTMSIAVVRRRAAIGTLRALGLGRRAVRGAFLLEGLLFGLAGGVAGIGLGLALARAMLGTVGVALSINFVEVHPTRLHLSPSLLLGALGFAVALSLLAALGPANEAAITPPANVMRAGTLDRSGGRLTGRILAGLVLLALAVLIARGEPRPGLPVEGFAAAALLVAAFVAWARPAALGLARLLRRPLARLFGAEGLLAVAGSMAAPGRTGVAVAGLLVALAMTVSVGVMVASFRDTVVSWMEQVLQADLYLTATPPPGRSRPDPLPAALVDHLEEIPGMAAVDPFRSQRMLVDGREAWVGAGRFDVVRFAIQTLDGRPAMEVLREARATDGLIVSEAFARKRGLAVGDRIHLPAPGGPLTLRVAGIYQDYSSEQGYAIMDRGLWLRHFDDGRIDSVGLYLEPGADRMAVRQAIARAVAATPGSPPVTVRAHRDLRAAAVEAFNRTFAITYALELIAIVVSVLGVATTLLAQILDRRQEISTLRWLGMSRRRVARVIVLESALIGLAGTALGTAAGIALSWILSRVVMLQSFGWTIAWRVPPGVVALLSTVVFGATLLAGLLPARQAAREAAVTGLPGGR